MTEKIRMAAGRALVSTLLACLCLVASEALAQPARPMLADYTVSYGGGDEFQIDARFAVPASKLSLFSFPNDQNALGQAAYIEALEAWDASGKVRGLKFLGDGDWEGVNGTISRVRYKVRAQHDRQNWGPGKDEVATRFDDTFFFAGNAFFLADYDWPDQPIHIRFDLPNGWTVTAPWSGSGSDFTAPRRRSLTFNVFAIGKDRATTETAGPVRLAWLSEKKLAPVKSQLQKLLTGLPAIYARFWGVTPVEELTVFAFTDPETDGGAFADSFALRLAWPMQSIDRVAWPHWLGHELMHLWNGSGRIRVAPDGSTSWFNEGVTDYLTVKLMRQSGLIDDATLKHRLANFARRYELGRKMSPGLKLAQAGAEKSKNWELIYGGGAMFGLLLDGQLSRSDPKAFQRALREVYRQADQPYDQQKLMGILDENSGGAAGDILSWLDQGLSWSQIRERLRPIGLEFSGFGSDEAYVDFAPCAKPSCVPAFLGQ